MQDTHYCELGDFRLQSGERLQNARLSYVTYGRLNHRHDNAILLPSWYAGDHRGWAALIGAEQVLDPAKYFIICTDMFGNGFSRSPSHAGPQQGRRFPAVTLLDNVRAQHRLISEHWHIERLALIAGWSMGAMQGYQWAALYPDAVSALLAVCGSAKCWPLNQVFLSGIAAALQADPLFCHGDYSQPPLKGLAAFGRCYAGWAYSAAFYRQHLYRQLNFPTREALLQFWEQDHQGRDANDLLCMLHSWQTANIADNSRFNGDFDAAMAAITARTIVMPCSTDSYFTLEEAEIECGRLARGEWRPLTSLFGHCAGASGRLPAESAFICRAMADLLAT